MATSSPTSSNTRVSFYLEDGLHRRCARSTSGRPSTHAFWCSDVAGRAGRAGRLRRLRRGVVGRGVCRLRSRVGVRGPRQVTSPQSRRHRGSARPRTLLRLLVGVVLLQSPRTAPSPLPARSAGATCQPDGDGVVAPQKITVNVFSSTTKAGLAARRRGVLRPGLLGRHGLQRPAEEADPRAAEVRFGPSGCLRGPRPQDRRSGCDASPGRAPGEHGRRRPREGFTSVGQLPVGTRPLCPAPSTSPSS